MSLPNVSFAFFVAGLSFNAAPANAAPSSRNSLRTSFAPS